MLKKVTESVLLGAAICLLAGCSSLRPAAGSSQLVSAPGTTFEAAAPEAERGIGYAALLYLPNRVVDLVDVISLHVGIPRLPHLVTAHPLHVNAHVTRTMQVGFGISDDTLCVGKQYGRRFTPWLQSFEELSVGPATLCTLNPTSGNDAIEFTKAGVLVPSDKPFDTKILDYWSIGAQATVLSVSAGAEVHPTQLADFILGFFMIDLGDDDF